MKKLRAFTLGVAYLTAAAAGAGQSHAFALSREADGASCEAAKEGLALDVLFILDNTVEAEVIYSDLLAKLPSALSEFEKQVTDVRWGLATMNDKPGSYLLGGGSEDNDCNHYRFALGSTVQELTDGLTAAWNSSHNKEFQTNGAPRDPLGAVANQLHWSDNNWRTDENTTGELLKKVTVVVTNDAFRYDGDGLASSKEDDLLPNDGNATYYCFGERHFSVDQAAKQFADFGVYPLFVVDSRVKPLYDAFLAENELQGDVRGALRPEEITERIMEGLRQLACVVPKPTDPPSSTPRPCLADQAFDVALAIDTTGSMSEHTHLIWEHILPGLDRVKANVPGTRVAMIGFNDKPSDDCPSCYCNSIDLRFFSSAEEVYAKAKVYEKEIQDNKYPDGSGDTLIDSLGVMASRAFDSLDWRDEETPHLHKMIVLFTDKGYKLPDDDVDQSRSPNDGDADYLCADEGYYNSSQTQTALHDNNVKVLVVTSRSYTQAYRTLFDKMNQGDPSQSVYGRTLSFNDAAELSDYMMEIFNLCSLPPTTPAPPIDPPTEPTDPPTEPTEAPTEPTDPPTDPPTEPTDPPTEPTDPPTEPTDPPTEPTDPPTEPTDPPTEPTDPPTEPTETPTEPTETPTETTEPAAQSSAPKVGVIVGAATGGAVALASAAGGAWAYRRRSASQLAPEMSFAFEGDDREDLGGSSDREVQVDPTWSSGL